MADSHRYAMLLTSLPDHGPLFGARQTPLSRLRLRQRLTLLDPEDAVCLERLVQLLEWAHQDLAHTDAEVVARARQAVADITDPFVRELLIWRLEFRTLVAALRRRRRGDPPPTDPNWGFGRWLGHLGRHWNEPGFRLEGAFPWLPEASRLIDSADALALERLLLGIVWDHLERLSDGHHFDFVAVVLYVLRWDLVARWTTYAGEAAVERFDALTGAGLAGVDLVNLMDPAA